MRNKPIPSRDAFTFSLGGLRVASTAGHAPAIADDCINKAIAERLSRSSEDQQSALERSKRPGWRFGRRILRRAT